MKDDFNKKKKINYILKKTKRKLRKSRNEVSKLKYLNAQASRMDKKKTWPEKEFENVLKEIGIKYETQKILKGKIFDYYIPSTNTLCEVDGDYYHGNPEKYEVLSEMQKKSRKNDKWKNTLANGMGYNMFRVWESELKIDRNAVIERVRKEILNY